MKEVENIIAHKPELDVYVAEELIRAERHIAIDSEDFARRNRPPLQGLSMDTYFGESHLRYQKIIDTVGLKLQGLSIKNEVAEDETFMREQLQTLHNRLSATRESQITIEIRASRQKPPYGRLRIPLVWAATAILFLADAVLTTPVFQAYGYSLIEALTFAVLFAGILTLAAHLFRRIISLGSTPVRQRLVGMAIFALLACIFWFMASARAEYLTAQTADVTDQRFSPWPFVLTSLLIFGTAVALHHFLYPHRVQRAEMRDCLALKGEQEALLAEQKRIEGEIENRKQSHAELRHVNGSLLEYGCMIEQLIISHAQAGLSRWKKINLLHRPDGGMPAVFDRTGYPFTFSRNFDILKNIGK